MAREDEVVDAGSCSDEGSDAELLARSARGDRRAFDAIITRYGPMALRVAGRMALDRQSAEDIAQEAMVRIWQRAGEFDACRARLSTWLYRIVINLCIDSRRRPQPLPLPQGFDAVDPSPNAAETREVDERSGALARAIDELPSRQRAALTLTRNSRARKRRKCSEFPPRPWSGCWPAPAPDCPEPAHLVRKAVHPRRVETAVGNANDRRRRKSHIHGQASRSG